MSFRKFSICFLLAALILSACAGAGPEAASVTATPTAGSLPAATTTAANTATKSDMMNNLIPKPVFVQAEQGVFTLTSGTSIYIDSGSAEIQRTGRYLADKLRPSTGFGLQVLPMNEAPPAGNIILTTAGGDPSLGEEGYTLTITPDGVTLAAYRPAGLFRGVQTIRQLLPAAVESSTLQPGPWQMAAGTIRDMPRFAWRGAMLDVARHFFKPDEVKVYIDVLAYYKINIFHLHLTDDQGWRIMINSWPELAEYGGSTEVGGGPGGYYTQVEYAGIVAYAQERYITVIPEIDLPGHTNAALASYAELNCNDKSPALYTGTTVGFSSLCIGKDITYQFVDDVIRELAALTPGPYIHIGGDEARATQQADYASFIEQVQEIVKSHGKQMVGWEEIAQANLDSSSIAQHWDSNLAQKAVAQGCKVVMSPASKAYLDMKYNASTPLGQDWAGLIDVQTGYDWDPAAQLSGIGEANILGVEAPLWSETLQSLTDIDFMTYPRLIGYAEMGWSPQAARSWDDYRLRLAAHGARLSNLLVNFYQAPEIPWR